MKCSVMNCRERAANGHALLLGEGRVIEVPLCAGHWQEWDGSGEALRYQEIPSGDPPREQAAVTDFLTRMRLEAENGGRGTEEPVASETPDFDVSYPEPRSKCGKCPACEIERSGICACDGYYDDGCFCCTPDAHKRPPCPVKR